jgi:serine/threonine-protein kinase
MSLLRREKRIPWEKAFEISIQVCQALKAAHDVGIIHRDLKPSNLLVSPEGIVKLSDFGVAQVFASDRLTATGGIIGTAEFMSPEQAQGKRAGKQSDLYSLGAVLYAMITGRTPFVGSTAVEVIQKHKFGLFDRPKLFVPDLPTRVDETICKLLEKEPEKRFPDALVLLRHLEQTLRLEEFAKSGATLTDEINIDDGAPTIAATDRAKSPGSSHPGPATLMQTLMRAELAEAVRGGFFTALFNNVYVLTALLALVILGGFLWIKPHRHSPEERQQMFDSGAALLEQSPGPEWLRAKREFFDPLLQDDPGTWREPLAPLLRKIELYELTRPIRKGQGSMVAEPPSEPERLLQLAMHYRQIGDLVRAERMLAALDAILAGDPDQAHLRDLAAQLLSETRKQLATGADRDQLLNSALARARTLAGEGSVAEARQILAAIVELYADDPGASEFVTPAREALAELRER